MRKLTIKILVLALVCGALAFAAHSVMASDDMDGMTGMSASCFNLCITQAETGTAMGMLASLWAMAVLVVVWCCIALGLNNDPRARIIRTFFNKDRHRYLMKSMVMLR